MKRLMMTFEGGFTMESEEYPVVYGKLQLQLPPVCAIVLRLSSPTGQNPQETG